MENVAPDGVNNNVSTYGSPPELSVSLSVLERLAAIISADLQFFCSTLDPLKAHFLVIIHLGAF